MTSTTTEKTLEALRTLFARYGLPRRVVSDNGPQFTSSGFKDCMKANGVEHVTSAPYHPATNGEAERFVQTFKKSMKAGRVDPGTLQQKLARFLMAYRSTPHTTTGVTPAELFLGRQIHTRLDLLKPGVRNTVMKKQAVQKKAHDVHAKNRNFQVGQAVLVLNFREGPRWIPGKILEKMGPVSYQVVVQGQTWKRHIDQLLANQEGGSKEAVPPSEEMIVPALEENQSPGEPEEESPPSIVTSPNQDAQAETQLPESAAVPLDTAMATEATMPTTPKRYPQRQRAPYVFFEPTL